MNKDVLKQVDEHLKDGNEPLLYKAILFELTSQYNYIKEDYTDFENVDLTLDDLKHITNDVMDSYYLSQELNETLNQYLYDYVKNKQENN